MLQEQRVFDPQAEVAAEARIGGGRRPIALADAAKDDPDRWGMPPAVNCTGSNPSTVLNWSMLPAATLV